MRLFRRKKVGFNGGVAGHGRRRRMKGERRKVTCLGF